MKYTSTRSASIITTFEDAIFSGYAPDGGLYVPIELPIIGTDELQKWSSLGYVHLAYEIFRYFIDEEEISNGCLREICSSSFEGFDHPSHAVPVVKVGNFFISELFHGPTYCFKDLGMRVTVGLLSHFASIRMRRITLVVSTTGDTGPAAVKAVADLANPLLTILVHYPKGQISSFQRKQMTTIKSKMVKVAEFEGGGDDMDKPIKSLLAKQDKISEGHYLCGVNSYNFARPMAQIVHHVRTSFCLFVFYPLPHLSHILIFYPDMDLLENN
jgi:threonine synthase